MQKLVILLGGVSVSVSNPRCSRTSRVWRAFLVLVWVLAVFLGPQALPVSASHAAGYSEYYVLGDEAHILAALQGIPRSGARPPVRSRFSLVVIADGANVYLDDDVDGYDFDPGNPAGTADASWLALNKGDVLTWTEAQMDGGDRLYITGAPVSVVRIVWAETPGTYLAGSWALYPVRAWQSTYVVPVGENLSFPGSPDPFEYTFLFVEAAADNTRVVVRDLAGAVLTDTVLSQGQNIYLPNINAGTRVVATDATTGQPSSVQAGLITSVNEMWDSRYYTLTPEEFLCNEYYLPVPSMQFPVGQEGGRNIDTAAYIYAFQNDTVVTIETATGTQTITLANAGDVYRYVMPRIPRGITQGPYGARITSSDGMIWVLVAGDDNLDDVDWGYQAMCPSFLDDEYYLPFAPANPAHITPIEDNTTFFVDWDSDGVVDETFTLDRFDTRMLYPPGPGYDATGAHIYATGRFAMAWGQDNTERTPGEPRPDYDYGYTILPLEPGGWLDPVLTLEKTVNPPSLPAEGGAVQFTLVAATADYPVYNIDISDVLPSGWRYINGTTTISFSDGTPASNADPAGAPGPDLLWDLNHDLEPNQSITVIYSAETIPGAYSAGLHDNLGRAYGEDANGAVFRPEDHAFVSIPSLPVLSLNKTSSVEGVVEMGAPIAYTVCFSNTGFATATGVVVTDLIPANTTYVAGSVTGPAPPIAPPPPPPDIEYRTDTGEWVSPEPATVTGLRWNIGQLVTGTIHCVSFQVQVTAQEGAGVINTATIDSNETDPLDDTVANPFPGFEFADPTIVKSGDPTVVSPGETATFTLRVTNVGLVDAQDVVVTDVIPGHFTIRSVTSTKGTVQQPIVNNTVIVDIGTIASNSSEVVVITIVTEVRAGTPAGTVMQNQASLAFRGDDPRQSNIVSVRVPGGGGGGGEDEEEEEAPAPTPTPTPSPVQPAPVIPTPTVEVLAVAMLPETGSLPGWFTVVLGIPALIGAVGLLSLALEMKGRRGGKRD